MSLRWRIALGLALIAALVCAVGAAGAYLTTKNQLENSIDDSLLARVASSSVARGPDFGGDPGRAVPAGRRVSAAGRSSSPPRPRRSSALDGTITKCIAGRRRRCP